MTSDNSSHIPAGEKLLIPKSLTALRLAAERSRAGAEAAGLTVEFYEWPDDTQTERWLRQCF
jgi:hypothetical protein